MIGTLVNTGAILVGGVCGHLFGRLLKTRHQETLTMACGVGTLFIGMAGALQYMLHHDLFPGGGAMLVVACLALGGLIGEIINIDEDMLEAGSIACPSCGEELEFDLDEEEEDD